jgi:serine/threonine protein kinase
MVKRAKLANLVHIANNAKTDAQKNAVGEEVKKLLRGKKACSPKQELFSNKGIKIEKGKNLRMLGKGAYGAVFYGCLEDACKTQIAIKVTTEPSAKMEYRIADKLRGMGVPRMYHFKSCNDTDILYFEYIKGETLQEWMKRGQTAGAYRSLISQLIKNLKKIHEKYPKFRHHDLHWNNILVLEGNKPIIIDFGLSTIDGVRNPDVVSGEFKNNGIYVGSHHMYDVHYILNIIYKYTNVIKVRNFIRDLFPAKYLNSTNPWIKLGRLRPGFSYGLPTYDDILEHPFLQPGILRKILPKKRVPPKKVVAPPQKVGTASAIRRARAVLQKEAEKKKVPPKRPGVAKRDPSVMNQVREIEKKIATEKKPKIFMNKNGDLKIDKKKCRLYKKEDLVKMFKLDSRMTKEQMCKLIKNM